MKPTLPEFPLGCKPSSSGFSLFSALFLILFPLLFAGCKAQAVDISNLPDLFKKTIPVQLKTDLLLVDITDRCKDCEPWRYIDFHSNESPEPIKREKVSVNKGYRAMYAYPGTEFFSNTKIEQSVQGEFENDKRIVKEAIIHEANRKKDRVTSYLKQKPDLAEKMEPHRAKGKDYFTFEEKTYKGFEYISYTENVIGLTGSAISQVHIFVPKADIIITAYLLRQERAKFNNIEEFLQMRQDFIQSYIDFLSGNFGNKSSEI